VIKQFLLIIIGVVAFFVLLLGLVNRFFPGRTLPLLSGEKSPLKNLACAYPVKVAGHSMEPSIKEGTVLNLNKCIDDIREKLEPETVIAYKKFDQIAIGRIKPKTEEPKMLYYNVSQDARPTEINHVFPADIIAVYEE
jgi:signal peptidase I